MRTAWYRDAPRGSRLSKPGAAIASRMNSGHVSGGPLDVPLQARQSLIMLRHFVLSTASGCLASVHRCIVNMRHFAVGQHANRLQTSKLTVYHFTALFRSAPSILAERTQRSHAFESQFHHTYMPATASFCTDLQAMSILYNGSRLLLQAYMHGPTKSACKVSGMLSESSQVYNCNSSQEEGSAAVKRSTGFFQPDM
jgi:hypothetical protein